MSRLDWQPFAIGVGGNVGDRAGQVASAVAMLSAGDDCRSIRVASAVTTTPVVPADRMDDHPAYLNTAIVGETTRSPAVMMARLLAIEAACGRRRRGAVDPRTLDLDLLVLGRQRADRTGLELPHPRLAGRRFVIDPLFDLLAGLEERGGAIDFRLAADLREALEQAGVSIPPDS